MRLIRLMGPIILALLFLAVFLLRSKPDSQTTSSTPLVLSPQKPQVFVASPPSSPNQSTKFTIKSLSQDLIEVGTERHSPPKPYLKLNKWEGEANLKVGIPYNTDETPQEVDGKLRYTGEGVKVDFYPKTPQEITQKDSQGNEHKFTINEEGGVEFDTILYEKPNTNQIVFPIETKGLKFYYQPELTQQEKDKGAFRPENVIGSYAVYHESKSGDYTALGGKNYRAGKAFHIYRPKVCDANNNCIWGELNITIEQYNNLTITIPQDWLDTAVYPVTIDPNFGYETAGSSLLSAGNNGWYGSLFTSPSDAGTATSITAYGKAQLGSAFFKGTMVLHSDLTIITNGIGSAVAPDGTAGWDTSTFGTAPTLAISTGYVISFVAAYGAGYYRIGYDGGDANQGHYETDNNYSSPTNPSGITHDTNKYSIYATYTAAATPTPTPTPIPTPIIKFNGLKMEGIKVQ